MNILYAVQDWGLGHATRSASIIQQLIDRGHHLWIYGSGQSLDYLQARFPGQNFERARALDFHYGGLVWLSRCRLASLLTLQYREDRRWMTRCGMDFDIIISDARAGIGGFRQNGQTSIFLNHQWETSLYGIDGKVLQLALRRLTAKYDYLWVPDTRNLEASHELGKLEDVRARYIGWQTSIRKLDSDCDIDLLAILSGPEPHRSALERSLLKCLDDLQKNSPNLRCELVRGSLRASAALPQSTCNIHNLLDHQELSRLINRANVVICRSGYSSIMDMMYLGKPAILIPTPSQPEQGYLASFHGGEGKQFRSIPESDLSGHRVEQLLAELKHYTHKPREAEGLLAAFTELGL